MCTICLFLLKPTLSTGHWWEASYLGMTLAWIILDFGEKFCFKHFKEWIKFVWGHTQLASHWSSNYVFPSKAHGSSKRGGRVWMRSATSRAPMVYLWFLIMTAGIPLVALCIQSDGGPHTTGGTEPEYEPWRIRENDPQALKPRTSQTARWAREHTGSDNQCMLQKSE